MVESILRRRLHSYPFDELSSAESGLQNFSSIEEHFLSPIYLLAFASELFFLSSVYLLKLASEQLTHSFLNLFT